MAAISIENSSGVRLKDIRIANSDVGVRVRNSNFTAEGVSFDNVTNPWDVDRSQAEVSGTRVTRDPKKAPTKNKSMVGWQRPSGPPLPAFCPGCKSVFPSRNYNFGSSRFYSRDNEEVCPVCKNEHAKLSDGLFDLTAEAVRIISAPDITHAMLASIAEVSNDVANANIEPQAAVQRLNDVSPSLANLARKSLQIGIAAFYFFCASAGLASVYYAHQALSLQREALDLQKQERLSSDRAAEEVLDALAELRFVLVEPDDEPSSQADGEPSETPSGSRADCEPAPAPLKDKS